MTLSLFLWKLQLTAHNLPSMAFCLINYNQLSNPGPPLRVPILNLVILIILGLFHCVWKENFMTSSLQRLKAFMLVLGVIEGSWVQSIGAKCIELSVNSDSSNTYLQLDQFVNCSSNVLACFNKTSFNNLTLSAVSNHLYNHLGACSGWGFTQNYMRCKYQHWFCGKSLSFKGAGQMLLALQHYKQSKENTLNQYTVFSEVTVMF